MNGGVRFDLTGNRMVAFGGCGRAHCGMLEHAEAREAGRWIEDVAAAIGQHVDAWRVVLFGGQARGAAREDGDVGG